MNIDFTKIQFGKAYDRPTLATLWGYQSFHAISKGVITPKNTRFIIFFVTKEKQSVFPQYNDFIDGHLLFWEGEEKHSSDSKIINAQIANDEIHLFYRDIHHTPFVYFGKIQLLDYKLNKNMPSEFVFNINSIETQIFHFNGVQENSTEYKILNETEQNQIIVSRIGQGDFRKNVIRLWGSCSLSGLQRIDLLRASHIKPWKDSNNQERLSPFNGLLLIPNYDLLFDKGLISIKDNGEILISQRLDMHARRIFRVNEELHLRKVFPENKAFFEYHRDVVFESL